MSYGIKLHISGDFACFTRPEMKVERVSYDVITPSAARGILEAIYWKLQLRPHPPRPAPTRTPRHAQRNRHHPNAHPPLHQQRKTPQILLMKPTATRLTPRWGYLVVCGGDKESVSLSKPIEISIVPPDAR